MASRVMGMAMVKEKVRVCRICRISSDSKSLSFCMIKFARNLVLRSVLLENKVFGRSSGYFVQLPLDVFESN